MLPINEEYNPAWLYDKELIKVENDCGILSRKNIFRLIASLCLVLIINPVQYFPNQELPAQELVIDGIGGGYLFEEEFLEKDDGIMLLPESFESVDSFSKARMLLYNPHIVRSGDNISTLAVNYGLNQDTIISLNKITNSRLLQVGKVLKIPNQDGILYTIGDTDNLASIAEKYNTNQDDLITINELFSEKISAGTDIFIPGARLDIERLQEINGDLFIRPVVGAITSYFGWRRNPFNRSLRQFHNGIDIRGGVGTPVRASMSGRVSAVGYDNVFGNYVIINHHSGYRTLYGHLNVIRTRTGANVAQGARIGDVGNTGQSTGPHLHFTIYRNGTAVNPLGLMR